MMWFWWFMLGADLLIPVMMMVLGRLMWKHPPRNINMLWGYRTARSMKNIYTWEFANGYCGRLWWRLGQLLVIPSVLVHLPAYGASEGEIGALSLVLMAVQFVAIVASILSTEKALKKNFTGDGTRR